MKFIPNKVFQEKDAQGVLQNVNYPAQDLPTDSLKIVFDGLNNQWVIAYDDKDIQTLFLNFPPLKQIDDAQKISPGKTVADDSNADPLKSAIVNQVILP